MIFGKRQNFFAIPLDPYPASYRMMGVTRRRQKRTGSLCNVVLTLKFAGCQHMEEDCDADGERSEQIDGCERAHAALL